VPVMAGEPGWRALPPILPGADPVAALARELATAARQVDLDWTVAHVQDKLGEGSLRRLVDELLLAAPGGPWRRLLVVLDQFEELLTQTAPADRSRFAELLRPALTGPVHLVATLRPEFLDQVLAAPDLAALPMHTHSLRPLRRETLRAVIEKPARLAGIGLDDGLVDRLITDTDSGDALPLLAFTLAQLAEGVRRGGRLSTARYEQLGRVQSALTRQADAALADAARVSGRSCEEVIAGLLRLVTVDEEGRPTRWRVNHDELPDPVITELDSFVTRRLLSTDTDNGAVVIGVTHEAFLSAWAPLTVAIATNASALRARRVIEQAATEWHENDRPPFRLWGGGQLAAAVADTGARIRPGAVPDRAPPKSGALRWLPQRRRGLLTECVDLSPKARDFLHASIRRDRYRRGRATTVLSVLLVLALAAAGFAGIQQRTAEDRQRIAIARQLVAQADDSRDTDPRIALQLGIAAQRIYPGSEAQSSLVNTLTTTRYAGTLISHNGPVSAVAFSPADRNMLVTGSGDGTVILWNVTDLTRPHPLGPPLTGHSSLVSAVAFAPDGRTLATSSYDGSVILWDLTDPTRPRQFGMLPTDHTGGVNSVAFSGDGRALATGNSDHIVILSAFALCCELAG